jgi:hypothetical protein
MAVVQSARLVCACGLFAAAGSVAAAQSSDSGTSMEMSVQVSITSDVVDTDGNQILPAPVPTVFRLTRMRGSAGWQTVVTYGKYTGIPTRASSHPLDGARVEFDDATGATRVYNSAGVLNPLLSTDSAGGVRGALGPGQWLDGLVARDNEQPTRLRDLLEKYGKPVGRVRGLDRFLTQLEETVEEVLADSHSALLREINTVRDGSLESHIVFDYERRADGAWVRKSMRAEHVVPGDATRRTRTTVQFTELSTGGR